MKVLCATIFFFYSCLLFAQPGNIYHVKSGKVIFQSKAPFEIIKASSNEVNGLLDIDKKAFAFKVGLESFEGFNSTLQKEHFNENYVESDKFPEATFSGKIIEDIDLLKDGVYSLRAKGNFTIHGVTQQRIIKCELTSKKQTLRISTDFMVLLSDHNIPIPKVVKDKLSSEINVQVNCLLEPR